MLDLYVGNPPSFPLGACTRRRRWPTSSAAPSAWAATLIGALTVAAVLWRQPVDRLRARLVRDATIFTGLDSMTIPLLRRWRRPSGPRASS